MNWFYHNSMILFATTIFMPWQHEQWYKMLLVLHTQVIAAIWSAKTLTLLCLEVLDTLPCNVSFYGQLNFFLALLACGFRDRSLWLKADRRTEWCTVTHDERRREERASTVYGFVYSEAFAVHAAASKPTLHQEPLWLERNCTPKWGLNSLPFAIQLNLLYDDS